MSILAHKWVASGALAGKEAFANARVCVVLHGIMGSGRNWMTAARKLVDRVPQYKCLLVDHRGHGANGTIAGPHTVAAAARDVAATVAHATGPESPTPSAPGALLPSGAAPVVLGHSFGGKVGLAYAASLPEPPTRTWLLDSNPRANASLAGHASGTADVLAALEAVSVGTYVSKAAAVAALEACGLEAPTAQWLAMTTARDDQGVRFAYDVPAVRALYEDYLATDLEPAARGLAAAGRLGVVVAGRADAVPRDLGLAPTYTLDAGHNVHVDDLPGLLDVLAGEHAGDWT